LRRRQARRNGSRPPRQVRKEAAAAAHLRVPAVHLRAADRASAAILRGTRTDGLRGAARKWRPKTFDEIVGQGHVTRRPRQRHHSGKIHHAYCSPYPARVGKTTFRPDLARALTGEKGPTPTPCLTCPRAWRSARDRRQENRRASNTGIDDIRSLRENAAYAPCHASAYKVYIIDEVTCCRSRPSTACWKTLEEPPPHVVSSRHHGAQQDPDTILSAVAAVRFPHG